MIKLYNDDCFNIFPHLEDNSIDLTVTSPPYDNLRTYNNSLEWGEDIWKNIIRELYRGTKQGGVVVWVVADATIKGSETGTSFRQALHAIECGFRLHDTMIYKKINYMPQTHNRYEQCFEYIFVWSKGRPKTFNPIMVECTSKGIKKYRGNSKQDGVNYSERKRDEYTITKSHKQHSNIFEFTVGTDKDKHRHTAPFPLNLAITQILSWSNEYDTVFDPMMGSGTTGLACKNLNRNFIGIEKELNYYEIAKQRIGEI